MKKNFNDKQKKSYQELVEEQDLNKEVFKRSEQPRKQAVILKEEIEKPKFKTRSSDSGNKPYQRKDIDQDDRSSKGNSRNTTDYKKPYTPRQNNISDQNKIYVPRTGSVTNKPSTPYIKK